MNEFRLSLTVGLGVALVADGYAFVTRGMLRSILINHHWIFYLYATVIVTLAVAGTTLLLLRLWRVVRAVLIRPS